MKAPDRGEIQVILNHTNEAKEHLREVWRRMDYAKFKNTRREIAHNIVDLDEVVLLINKFIEEGK